MPHPCDIAIRVAGGREVRRTTGSAWTHWARWPATVARITFVAGTES